MNTSLPRRLALLAAGTAASLTLFAAELPSGYVDFGKLVPSADAEQFVEVHIQGNLLKMAAKLAKSHEPDVAELIGRLEHVRVNVVGLGEDNRSQVRDRVASVRKDLEGRGWEKVVTVQEKNEDISVFLKARGADVVEGVMVTVISGDREAVFVNVVGEVDIEKLGQIGERLNLPPLQKLGGMLEKAPKSEAPKPADGK